MVASIIRSVPAKLAITLAGVSSPPAPAMTQLTGSSNQTPVFPTGASVLTLMESDRLTCCPDVSINPPLPLTAPPRAERVPAATVLASDQTVILPPLPVCMASALIMVCSPSTTFCAFGVALAWKSLPICTSPPPAAPLTSIRASPILICLENSSTCPPVCCGNFPEASNVPVTLIVPFSISPSRRMLPFLFSILRA